MTSGPPTGFSARPPTLDDLQAVLAVLRADEATVNGEPYTTVEDVRSDWTRPSFDLQRAAVVVTDGASDDVVGYGEVSGGDGRAWVGVAPEHHGRGIGTWLAAWTEDCARALGHARVGQTVDDRHQTARTLLASRGYEPTFASWVFSMDLADLPDARTPAVRSLRRPEEDAIAYHVVETAFSEWPGRGPGPDAADWIAAHLDRSDVHTLVAEEDGRVVGVAVCLDEGLGEGWVEQLATVAEVRGRGYGHQLLQAAFRHFRSSGCTTAGLSTDSRTGARSLYERVGMTVQSSYTRWVRDLGAGS